MSRLGDVILPIGPESDYDSQLNRRLYDFFRPLVRKVNGLASGVFGDSADNASVALPTTGTYLKGDYVAKAVPVVSGVATQQYVIRGWLRITDGSAHVLNTDWVECRTLTGT
jgi:hypothetical protein